MDVVIKQQCGGMHLEVITLTPIIGGSYTRLMLWGMVVVCSFLNMKLARKDDKRNMWMYKHSPNRYSIEHAPTSGFRRRNIMEQAGAASVEPKCPERNLFALDLTSLLLREEKDEARCRMYAG